MSIEEYFGDWCKVLDIAEANRVVKNLQAKQIPICPKLSNVFKAFHLCSLRSLRVVVIGEDPYPTLFKGSPIATGIAFANVKDTPEERFSPSLDVIKESFIDFSLPKEHINFDPSLEKLEEQGVLMLNSALTCKVGQVGSHSLLWRPFMRTLISKLSSYTPGLVFILMGKAAQSMEIYIDHKFHHILKEKHPSYYARKKIPMPSDVWKETNRILVGQNGYGINWY